LQWLKDPRFPDYKQLSGNEILIHTIRRDYTICELAALRNFAAHGQATSHFQIVDYQIISLLRVLVRDGLEHYWAQLVQGDDLCNRLALANVVRLREWPVLKTWVLLQGNEETGPQSITSIFDQFAQAFAVQ
jgi:hypothetical protein